MAYFQAITDVASLYGMDRIIRRRLFKELPDSITGEVHTLVDTYYAIRREGGGSLVEDYDAQNTTGQKRNILVKRGWIDEHKSYTDEQIDISFNMYMEFVKKRAERNIGGTS